MVLATFLVAQQAMAAVTVQAWYHLGEPGSYGTSALDASGNGRNISSAYSHVPPNNPAYGGNFMGIVSEGVGGPLGNSGYTSTSSLRSGRWGTMICTMWGTVGIYNPPPTNYFMEIWVQPYGVGYVGGPCWIFSSGQSGGYVLRVDGNSSFVGTIIGANDVGDPVPIDTTSWTHLAMVNDNGVTTFYVNGVPSGASDTGNATKPAGDIFFGNPNAWQGFDGLIDEARICTFDPGTFSTSDFLLRPAGPNILTQPQSATVWEGGSAIFTVSAALDASLTYKWRRGGATMTEIPGATAATYRLPQAALTDSGAVFDCVLANLGGSQTSSVATLTVLPRKTTDVDYYRAGVTSEASLAAYFPVDYCTGTVVTNVADATRAHDGALELNATYDGQTNHAFGQLALSFNADGDVQIPKDAAYEFSSGNGTVEALVYMSTATGSDPTIFSVATDGGDLYYALQASRDGGSLLLSTNSAVAAGRLSWPVPNLIGRLAHIAVVFDHGTNVTPYVDGMPLATKNQAFGPGTGSPAWIGSLGTGMTLYRWQGTIDELAVYTSALPMTTVQTHYSRFVYGTNIVAPSIVSQSTSKTGLLAGGSPALVVKASGTLPLNYQWKSNDVAIVGATSPTLTLSHTKVGTATYILEVQNSVGTNMTDPIVLTFVAPPAGYATTVMNDSPAAFWRLAEGVGATAVDSAGLNDGAYGASGVTYGVPGIPGESATAVYFGGSPGRALVPYSPTLNPNGSFTVEFWAKPDNYSAAWVNPLSSLNRPSRDSGYEFYLGGNYPGWEFHTSPGGYSMMMGDGNVATAGTWYHVVGVYNTSLTPPRIHLYVNGEITEADSDNNWGDFVPNSVKGFYIGSRSDDVRYFLGAMQNVAFYNYALTTEQIRSHVTKGMPLTLSLAKTSGIVVDSKPSGTPHHGVNHGATWAASNGSRSGVMQFVDTNSTQITVPTTADFDSTTGTIMFWMRSAGAGGSGSDGAMILDRRTTAGNVVVLYNDGTLFMQASGSANTFHSATVLADDAWHHVTIVYDTQGTGTVTVYVDGSLDSVNANTAAWSWPAGQQIELGVSHDGYWMKFNGFLDDVRFYNRMLDNTEVNQAVGGSLVDTAALVGRYNFDAPPVDGMSISWVPLYGTLQWSPTVPGTFLDLPGATTPYLVVPSGAQMYFRSKISP